MTCERAASLRRAGLWLGLFGLASWPSSAESAAHEARIVSGEIELGTTYAELIDVAEWCNRLSRSTQCKPEDFALELSLGRREHIDSFFIDRREVSVNHYERCMRAGRCAPHQMNRAAADLLVSPDHPVTMIRQGDAARYCEFVGKRLPSEEQFERAARGSKRRRFPWGELFHAGRVNGGSPPPRRTESRDGYELLAPVEAFADGQTPEGVLQLAGNAAEWTSSRLQDSSGRPGAKFVVRGGHFASPPWHLRSAHREALLPGTRRLTIGFRCARPAP